MSRYGEEMKVSQLVKELTANQSSRTDVIHDAQGNTLIAEERHEEEMGRVL